MATDGDKSFTGSIPRIYDDYLVPLIFLDYAADIVARLSARLPARVLEVAAGTGVVTRAMSSSLPPSTTIVATDLNQAMLDHAAAVGTSRPVEWRAADAVTLPFDDASFDAVVCQFGVMFFPDKPRAFAEVRRVLKPGGAYLFNVWDRIENTELADAVTAGVASVFPTDPPRFFPRGPHGYSDIAVIQRDLRSGGFDAPPEVTTLSARSRTASPRLAAIAFCQGTPLRNEITARDPAMLDRATDAAAAAVAMRFGNGPVDAKIQAHVFVVQKS